MLSSGRIGDELQGEQLGVRNDQGGLVICGVAVLRVGERARENLEGGFPLAGFDQAARLGLQGARGEIEVRGAVSNRR